MTIWRDAYHALAAARGADCGRAPRPLVGITGNFGQYGCQLAEGYYESVRQAGGVPVVVPPGLTTDGIGELLDRIDGLVLSGGGDINPLQLGEEPSPFVGGICEERDCQEMTLARMAIDRQMPILGICRGIQVIAAVCGGSLMQDIKSEAKTGVNLIKHSQDLDRRFPSHTVAIEPDSLLYRILDEGGSLANGTIAVNSLHHQAVADSGSQLHVTARSRDGIIEAVESAGFGHLIGVQWHPETFILRGDDSQMPLFRWLAESATEYRQANAMHDRFVSLDTHCDTPIMFEAGADFGTRDERILVDSHKMREGRLDACIMAAYQPQGERDEASLQQAVKRCDTILGHIEQMASAAPDAALAATADEVRTNKARGLLSVLRGIENGYAIGRDISNVERYRRRGVVYMTLCHNGDNDICDAASQSCQEHGGLSQFGERVVQEMNRVGMMVDLSHGSRQSFYDALDASRQPIVCSHSSCYSLCPHPRNLDDDQLRAIARCGGVVHVTAYPGFLAERRPADIHDFIAHLEHAISIAGIDHVGIGTDFDGDGGIIGMADASQLINLTRLLLRKRYSEDNLRRVWGGNWMRVMDEVQRGAQT